MLQCTANGYAEEGGILAGLFSCAHFIYFRFNTGMDWISKHRVNSVGNWRRYFEILLHHQHRGHVKIS